MPDIHKYQTRLLEWIAAARAPENPLSDAVRRAFLTVPRHLFIQRYCDDDEKWHDISENNLEEHLSTLYENQAMAIFEDKAAGLISTISQPSLVLKMIELLNLSPGQRVFELGAGSGWNAALMGQLVGEKGAVDSVEIIPQLIEPARRTVAALGLSQVHIIHGDGGDGLPGREPYDRAIFTAGSYDIPAIFFQQVRVGGLLLMVLKNRGGGDCLYLLRKEADYFVAIDSAAVGFIPVTGKYARRDLDALPIESLPGWETIKGDVRQRTPFWWSSKGKENFMWATSAVRSYLSVVEPRFQVFKVEAKKDLPGFDDGTFGLWDPESKSLVLCRSDEMTAYGGLKAKEELMGLLHRWLDAGMPGAICLEFKAFPASKKIQPKANEWLVKRGDAHFLYGLAAPV